MKNLAALAFVAFTGCAAPEDTLSDVDCDQTIPTYGELTIWPLCTSCHSSALTGAARQKAPANVDFDSYAAAAAQATRSAALVSAGVMPEAGSPHPSAEQKAALALWAACGTPE